MMHAVELWNVLNGIGWLGLMLRNPGPNNPILFLSLVNANLSASGNGLTVTECRNVPAGPRIVIAPAVVRTNQLIASNLTGTESTAAVGTSVISKNDIPMTVPVANQFITKEADDMKAIRNKSRGNADTIPTVLWPGLGYSLRTIFLGSRVVIRSSSVGLPEKDCSMLSQQRGHTLAVG